MRLRRIQVVGTEYEDTGPVKQRSYRIKEMPDGIRVRDGITGIDNQLRVEVIEGPDPGHEPLPAGGEMRIRNMQHAQRL